MGYIDERIAILERENRRQKAEEAEKKKDLLDNGENENIVPEITLEEMLEGVREGNVEFPDGKNYAFEHRFYFEDRIPVVLVRNFYNGVKEETETVAFVNNESNVCQMLMVSATDMEKMEIDRWKQLYKEEMKKAGIFVEIIKAASLEELDYLTYRAPTSKGWIYNIVFRINYGNGRTVGVFNCFEKDKHTYGLMLEAMIIRINELMKTYGEDKSDEERSDL